MLGVFNLEVPQLCRVTVPGGVKEKADVVLRDVVWSGYNHGLAARLHDFSGPFNLSDSMIL